MTTRTRLAWLVVVALVGLGAARLGLLDPARMGPGFGNLLSFAGGLWPPDPAPLGALSGAVVETLQMAWVGTALGAVAALPLALLSAGALSPRPVARLVQVLLSMVRTVPSLLWAVVFVAAWGLGPVAGTLGIAAYTTGYLGKLFAESLEGVDPEVIDAVRSTGCSRVQLARYALLPEAANALLSQLIFAFEYNVRASSILGFVGAGGIGFHLIGYVQMLQYQRLMTTLCVTLVVVLTIDAAGSWVRRRVRV